MTRKILLLAAAMLFADVALAQPPAAIPGKPSPSAGAGPQPRDLPAGQGKAVVQTVCAQCHNIDVVTKQARSREEWMDVMSRMIGNGAQMSDEEYNAVMEYLVMYYCTPADGKRGG
ncbi:MAG TPA: cytochrome c [Caulobacteraceae bacterium]|jgi:mono/diheme cytochrome c family protein|nr:cytochrome c [Caulobacteraceae bacterium]